MSSHDSVNRIDPTSSASNRQSQIQKMKAQGAVEGVEIVQSEMEDLATERTENVLFNPFVQLRRAETLDNRIKKHEVRHSSQSEQSDPDVIQVDAISKTAEEYQNRNPEMQKRGLLGLKKAILEEDTPEQILDKVLSTYPDHYLADEAFEFLAQTTDPATKIGMNLRKARDLLNERFGREVKAGRNINEQAKEFAKQGIGTTGSLRDLYRDITGNPREPLSLFEELTEAFTFDKMTTVLQFMLHSLGSDIKSKGPSIAPAELQRLFTEIRSMQAILGVYRFFFQRMLLIKGQFDRYNLSMPKGLTFEVLAKIFVKLISERYPSPEKILKFSSTIGIADEISAQVIIFTQYRDAMRGVSPRLFKSEKHRQDFLMVLIETISELDDLLDEEEDEQEEEKKKTGWNQEDTIE
jgi:type III secretion protein W